MGGWHLISVPYDYSLTNCLGNNLYIRQFFLPTKRIEGIYMTADVNEKDVVETENKDIEDDDKEPSNDIESLKQSIIDSVKEQFKTELDRIKADYEKEIANKNNELNDLRAINSALAMNTSGNKKEDALTDDFEDLDFDKVAKGILDSIDDKIINH